MIGALLNRTCVVTRGTAGTLDAAGAAAMTWAGAAQAAGVAVIGAAVGTVRCRVEALDSRAAEEVRVGKQLVRADWRVWMVGGVEVTEKDRLVLDDGRVLGVELVARYRGGVADHLEVYGVEVRV